MSFFSDRELQRLEMEYKPDVETKKKFSPTLRLTTLAILVFVGVSVIGVAFLLVSDYWMNRRLSAMENALEGLNQKMNQTPNISEASVQLRGRQKRSVSSNKTPGSLDFEKRLLALEKR